MAHTIATATFDYGDLDPETRIVVQQRTSEIHKLVKLTAEHVIEIGQKLFDVKGRLDHGQFGTWLQVEFQWAERTARRFMEVARALEGKSANVGRFAPSALYALAARSTPTKALEEAIGRAQQGEQITHAKAQEIIEDAKPPAAQVWEIETAIRELLDETNRGGHQAWVSLGAGWPELALIQRQLDGKTVRKNLAKQARANVREQLKQAAIIPAEEPAEAEIITPAQGDNVSWLTSVSTSDINFKTHLEQATIEELRQALERIEGQAGNKVRREILERRLAGLQALAWPCPTCGAKPTKPCMFPRGSKSIAHQSRINLARQMAEAGRQPPDPGSAEPQPTGDDPKRTHNDAPPPAREPAEAPAAATPAPDSAPPGADRLAAIVASQKAYIDRLERKVKELEAALELTEADSDPDALRIDEPTEDLDGWLPPLAFPESILDLNPQVDDTTPGPRDPEHSLANRIDSYCASMARAATDLEVMHPDKLIELIYSPAERIKGRPATLERFLRKAEELRNALHRYIARYDHEPAPHA